MRDKWKIYQVMKEEEDIHKYIPETQLLTEQSLWNLLEKYGEVIIKPCRGVQGYGVIQISSLGTDQYEVHAENRKNTLTSRVEVCNKLDNLKKLLNYKHYIVQQKISLATIDNNPFDIRVMVQRKKTSLTWVVTGKLAKVAANNFFITNVAQNVLSVEEAIQNSSISQTQVQVQYLLSEVDQSALLAAKQLETGYPDIRMIGLDIGIDQDGNIMFIEANFNPTISIFDLLKDKKMYQAIKSYRKG